MVHQPNFVLAGVLMKEHLASKDTGGCFSLFENRSSGPSRTPIHVHAHDDETLYILEGAMQAIIGGEEHSLKAGESIFLPRRVPASTHEREWHAGALPSALYARGLRRFS